MSDTSLPPSEEREPPQDVVSAIPQRAEYAPIPPDITLRPDVIVLKQDVFVVSVVLMVAASLITFYIPFFNGLLGGSIGGYHAGRLRRALGAAVVTSVVVPAILAFAHVMSEQPGLHFFSGLSTWGWLVLHVSGTFIGAVCGAASRPPATRDNLYGYA
jgi:hypothetical protein